MNERTCKPALSRAKKILLAASVAGCLAAGPATAGTIGISSGALVIGAEPSDTDIVLLGSSDATHFTLQTPSGATFDIVTAGCTVSLFGIDCLLSGFTSLVVIGSDGDDVFDFSLTSVAATLAGGLGNNIIFGTSTIDTIYGGSGDDVLSGDASDFFFGGPGDDIVLGGLDLGDNNPQFDPLPRPPAAVPEPGSMLLLLAGLGAAAVTRSRRQGRTLRYC
ncbi:MAG: PEP-CTERM sorting domain-containing protein [Betaproteobacteria bacterium]|nr:PEP-CTERM sorting domain-containing protein [Betaproteobacteria bacterium]